MAASIVTSATFASFANTSTATASAGCGPCTYLQIYGTSQERVENPSTLTWTSTRNRSLAWKLVAKL